MKIKEIGLFVASIISAIAMIGFVSFTQSTAETPDTITLINSGKAGGSFNARTQMYKEGLTAAGYNVQYEYW